MKRAGPLRIPETLGEMLAPERAALVVYDMQVGVLRQIADAGRVVARVGELVAAARSAGMPVLFMRHRSLPKALMGTMQYHTAMRWQRQVDPEAVAPWFLPDDPGFAITPELVPGADEAVFDKLSMSAFEGTPIEMVLRDRGINCVAVCGVAMEIGIDITLRHAADLGFLPVLIEDACGAGHPEAGERAVETLRFLGDTTVTTASDFPAVLDAARPT